MPKKVKKIQSAIVRTEFAAAISQIATERKIEASAILELIQDALVAAYCKEKGIKLAKEDEIEYPIYKAKVDQSTGEARIFEVVESGAESDVTPPGFGRIATQTAKQVILQKIREAEKDSIIKDYSGKIGELVTGMVLRMDGKSVVIDIGRGHGVMPPEEQMRGEFYRVNSRISVLIKDIRETFKGRSIIVSRSDKDLVKRLFEREVPELASGVVLVQDIAREAGVRTKIAVFTEQSGVDPVGACVGQKGVRVQEVIRELNNEKVDIIPFTTDQKNYLAAALAPAENLKIEIDDETKVATVTAPDDQLSLAIGRSGQNVRLAAKLTGYKISIMSAAGESAVEVTGAEEYEIDQQIAGLTSETRQVLVENRLTTLEDLLIRQEKWQNFDSINQEQKQLISDRIAQYQKDMPHREKLS